MLIIRREQWEVLAADSFEQFVRRMARHLRERFADRLADVDHAALEASVRAGCREARSFDIARESDVRQFLEYRVCYGDDFFTEPWASEVLTDPGASGPVKMRRLADRELDAIRERGR